MTRVMRCQTRPRLAIHRSFEVLTCTQLLLATNRLLFLFTQLHPGQKMRRKRVSMEVLKQASANFSISFNTEPNQTSIFLPCAHERSKCLIVFLFSLQFCLCKQEIILVLPAFNIAHRCYSLIDSLLANYVKSDPPVKGEEYADDLSQADGQVAVGRGQLVVG